MKAQKKSPAFVVATNAGRYYQTVLSTDNRPYLMKAKQMNTNKQQQDQQTEARGAA